MPFVDTDVLGSNKVLAVRGIGRDGEFDAVVLPGSPVVLITRRSREAALPNLEPVARAVIAGDVAAGSLLPLSAVVA